MLMKMTATEKQAVTGLSLVMALRMLGLFMILPLLALFAKQLPGATPTLIGLAMGIYGLTQALLQIPFGAWSDRIGRKPIITLGLAIFALGSFIAACSHTIYGVIIGRALQGGGAVGGTAMALLADLTREDQRTKAMAIAGMTIGLSFSLAMLLGPILSGFMAVRDLFLLTVVFAIVAIGILYKWVPQAHSYPAQKKQPAAQFWSLLIDPNLARLNAGIFFLHLILTASFIAIPISLLENLGLAANEQWQVYVPALFLAFAMSLFVIALAEKQQKIKAYFLGAIILLGLSELLLWTVPKTLGLAVTYLTLFLAAFSLLEATQPSLISRAAPADRKGTALGIYSCAQFSGIFVGGLTGGWLYNQFHLQSIFPYCAILTLVWFLIAASMKSPRYLITRLINLGSIQPTEWPLIDAKLKQIPGIVETTFLTEEKILSIRMEKTTLNHPEFLKFEEALQPQSH